MNNLTEDSLKKVIEIQKSIKINNSNYSLTKRNYNFSYYLLPPVPLRDIFEKRLSINDTDEKQSLFYNEIKITKHGRLPDKKRLFFFKEDLFLMEEKTFLMLLKVIYFQETVMDDDGCEKTSLTPSKIPIRKSNQNIISQSNVPKIINSTK